jgi:hypothetical protein
MSRATLQPSRTWLLAVAATVLTSVLFLAGAPGVGSAQAGYKTGNQFCNTLGEAAYYGSKIYYGDLDAGDFKVAPGVDASQLPPNLGYPKGPMGLQMWLTTAQDLTGPGGLNGGSWVSPWKIRIVSPQTPRREASFWNPHGDVAFQIKPDPAADRLSITQSLRFRDITSGRFSSPTELFKAFPPNCDRNNSS